MTLSISFCNHSIFKNSKIIQWNTNFKRFFNGFTQISFGNFIPLQPYFPLFTILPMQQNSNLNFIQAFAYSWTFYYLQSEIGKKSQKTFLILVELFGDIPPFWWNSKFTSKEDTKQVKIIRKESSLLEKFICASSDNQTS